MQLVLQLFSMHQGHVQLTSDNTNKGRATQSRASVNLTATRVVTPPTLAHPNLRNGGNAKSKPASIAPRHTFSAALSVAQAAGVPR